MLNIALLLGILLALSTSTYAARTNQAGRQQGSTLGAGDAPVTFPVMALYIAECNGTNAFPANKYTNSKALASVIVVNNNEALGGFEMTHIYDAYMAHIHVANMTVPADSNGPPYIWAFNSTCITSTQCSGKWQPFSVPKGSSYSSFYTFNTSFTSSFGPLTIGEYLKMGMAYFNVHTLRKQGGLIRGTFVPLKKSQTVTWCGAAMKSVDATTGETYCAVCGEGPGGPGKNLCQMQDQDGVPVRMSDLNKVGMEIIYAQAAGFVGVAPDPYL